VILAFTAGAINAGGFVAAGRYSSHMTGILSSTADALVVGKISLLIGGMFSLLAFVAGAITSTMQISWARRTQLHAEHAWSLVIEASLLLVVGIYGELFIADAQILIPATILLLCFTMGIQNAIIVKISSTEVRTTHMTGIVTDLGIELGRLFYWNRNKNLTETFKVLADRGKLKVRLQMITSFLAGAVCGSHAFAYMSFAASIPFAALLYLVALPAIVLDANRKIRGQSK
jgi:uncharacterized membrane protein YoaK (UPF0700 family)